MTYGVVGIAVALAVAAIAWRCSRSAGGYCDREVYGMDRHAHARYVAIGLGFAGLFGVAAALRLEAAGVAALAVFAVIAIFYLSSFLRGATDADE